MTQMRDISYYRTENKGDKNKEKEGVFGNEHYSL